MLGQVVDQRFRDPGPLARERHRQVEGDRLKRLGVGGKAVAAVDLRQIKADRHPACDHAVIVGRGKALLEAAIRLAAHFAGNEDRRQVIWQGGDLPFAPAGAFDGQGAGPGDRQIIHAGHAIRGGSGGGSHLALNRRSDRRGRVGDGLCDGQPAFGAIDTDLQARAGGQLQSGVGDVVQIQRRLAGIGRGLRPAFPAWPARHRNGCPGCKAGD